MISSRGAVRSSSEPAGSVTLERHHPFNTPGRWPALSRHGYCQPAEVAQRRGEENTMGHSRLRTRILAAMALLGLLLAPASKGMTLFTPAQASTTIIFGPSTIVDDQRFAAEPGIKTCGPASN